MKRTMFLFVCLLWSASNALWAQELNCTVTVNMENIPSTNRDLLKDFKRDVEQYINNTRYTTEELGGEKIDCTLNIFFQSVTGDNRYRVEAFIGSQRPIYSGNDKTDKVTPVVRIKDDKWEFAYIPGQRMLYDDFNFDPLTDFLDYYAFLIIGLDLETYVPMSGAKYFQKALTICNQAGSSAFGKDWQWSSASYNRYVLADELNSTKFEPARLA
ncbi:MAG: DUF4835 family protein, partial [Ignavibacteriales bacterium]|nr:DUF4835 family protein [Ignavibacteriales bacterium]